MPPPRPYLNEPHEGRYAGSSGDHDDARRTPRHHGLERFRGVVEPVYVHQQTLGRCCSRGSIGHEAQGLGPRSELLDVHREHFFLGQGSDLLG